jgi:glutamate-1-semialdehyde 2,1-aminomutase
VVLERGSGARVWDVDWNEYTDYVMSFGALIHGHANPVLVEAAIRAMGEGVHFAAATPAEVEAAERFCRMVPTAQRVRFTNSGSEATMLALRLARAHTARTKLLKFEGQYHGWYDPYLLNAHAHPPSKLGPPENTTRLPDSAGIPEGVFAEVILAPWNDVSRLESVFRDHGPEIAAAITEPIMANIGCIPPRPGYLERLRQLTSDFGALLIFDEVVTGFRYAPGGCQQLYGIAPDLSTFGKALGAGFPIGAVGGPRDILDRLVWSDGMVLHYGTFNGHRLIMKIVAANLDLLCAEGGAAFKRLHALGEEAIAGLRDVFRRRGVKAVVQGLGPMFQIYFTEKPAIQDYRDYCAHVDTRKYSYFVHQLLERGIYMTPSNGLHWIISTAHKSSDIEQLLVVADEVCSALA